MNYLEELRVRLDENDIPWEIVQDHYVRILTNIGYFTLTLCSAVGDDVDELVQTCRAYAKVWIYSVEPLAVSGKLMMRFAWVK